MSRMHILTCHPITSGVVRSAMPNQPERFRVLHDETGDFRPGAQFGLCDFRGDITVWRGVTFWDTKTGRVVTAWQIVERMKK